MRRGRCPECKKTFTVLSFWSPPSGHYSYNCRQQAWAATMETGTMLQRRHRMKIAEALALRADLQKRLEQLKQRLVKNARIQEGDKPEEEPVELQAELDKSAQELTVLIQRINRTNAGSRFGDRTIADALAERDVLKIRYNAYRELAFAAGCEKGRATRSEVKFISTVSVAAIQRKADDLAKQYREIDMKIQEADWTTTLLD